MLEVEENGVPPPMNYGRGGRETGLAVRRLTGGSAPHSGYGPSRQRVGARLKCIHACDAQTDSLRYTISGSNLSCF